MPGSLLLDSSGSWKLKTDVSAGLAPWGLWLACLSSHGFHTAHACVLTSSGYEGTNLIGSGPT